MLLRHFHIYHQCVIHITSTHCSAPLLCSFAVFFNVEIILLDSCEGVFFSWKSVDGVEAVFALIACHLRPPVVRLCSYASHTCAQLSQRKQGFFVTAFTVIQILLVPFSACFAANALFLSFFVQLAFLAITSVIVIVFSDLHILSTVILLAFLISLLCWLQVLFRIIVVVCYQQFGQSGFSLVLPRKMRNLQ